MTGTTVRGGRIAPVISDGFDIKDDGPGPTITCRKCGMASSHPMDVMYRYCGKCKAFHEVGPGPLPAA